MANYKYIFINTTQRDLRHGNFKYYGPYDTLDECKSSAYAYLIENVLHFDKKEHVKVAEDIFNWEIIYYYTGKTLNRIEKVLLIGSVKVASNTEELIKLEIDSKVNKRWCM